MFEKVKPLAKAYKKQLIVAGVVIIGAITTLVVVSQLEKDDGEDNSELEVGAVELLPSMETE